MPNILKVLDVSDQTQEVVLSERHGGRLRLKSPLPISPGSAVQLKLEGELLLGEVTASMPRCDDFEVVMEAREVLFDSWHLHPEWNTLDSEKSVMGSLLALNARLELIEEERRAQRAGLHRNLSISS